jgi:hypothetical protein
MHPLLKAYCNRFFSPVNFGLDPPSGPGLELRCRYCDCYGLNDPGFESRQVKEIFIFSKSLDRLWDPTSVLFNGYRGSFSQVKQPGRKMPTHLHLVTMFRINGPIYLNGVDRNAFGFFSRS